MVSSREGFPERVHSRHDGCDAVHDARAVFFVQVLAKLLRDLVLGEASCMAVRLGDHRDRWSRVEIADRRADKRAGRPGRR